MKTTMISFNGAMLFAVLFLFIACDYYESPQSLIEDPKLSESIYNEGSSRLSNDEDKITLYQVKGEDIIKIQDYHVEGELLEFQKDVAKHRELWELVKHIIPSNYREKMSQFLVYHGAKTSTSGFVDPTFNDLSQWQFAIAIDYAYKSGFEFEGDLVFTIIHEFGHILTLSNEQLTPGIIPDNCINYYVSKGCAKKNSYIDTFYNRFWKDIEEEFNSLETTSEAKSSFYAKYSDRFVSRYAASSPREDIAEVFASFVVWSEVGAGSTIAEKKIMMMYDFPELVQLRNQIRHITFLP